MTARKAPTRRDKFENGIDAAVPPATLLVFGAAILVSACSEVPSSLPGIALGSEPLFYVERTLALMAAGIILLMLLVRGLKRELPSQATTTGLGYPDPLRQAVSSAEALSKRIDKLEQDRKHHAEALRFLLERAKKEVAPGSSQGRIQGP